MLQSSQSHGVENLCNAISGIKFILCLKPQPNQKSQSTCLRKPGVNVTMFIM